MEILTVAICIAFVDVGVPVWLGEFGPHNGGGGGTFASTFLSSFGYVDTLGLLAQVRGKRRSGLMPVCANTVGCSDIVCIYPHIQPMLSYSHKIISFFSACVSLCGCSYIFLRNSSVFSIDL